MNPEPQKTDPEETPAPSGESLDEMTERTAEVMDDARKKVNRAKATLHDQIAPGIQSADEEDYEEEKDEGDVDVDKGDTRGAWPNWS